MISQPGMAHVPLATLRTSLAPRDVVSKPPGFADATTKVASATHTASLAPPPKPQVYHQLQNLNPKP